MFYSMQYRLITAYVLTFVGYEFDVWDGKVARWRNECSDWGKELDSFCDLVWIWFFSLPSSATSGYDSSQLTYHSVQVVFV